jgi:hypothetical protein
MVTRRDTVLSMPDGGLSEAHHKQDYHIASYKVAQLEGDPLVGPHCFSYTAGWGTPLYKLCHRSDVMEGTPLSSRRSSYAAGEEEVSVQGGVDAEVEEALAVLERAMARVRQLQRQSEVRASAKRLGTRFANWEGGGVESGALRVISG